MKMLIPHNMSPPAHYPYLKEAISAHNRQESPKTRSYKEHHVFLQTTNDTEQQPEGGCVGLIIPLQDREDEAKRRELSH